MLVRHIVMSNNDTVLYIKPSKKKKKTRSTPSIISINEHTIPFYVNQARYAIGSYAIMALVSITSIFLFFLIGLIPGIPPLSEWWRPAALYYFILYPLYILNLLLPITLTNEFYDVALLFNLGALILEFFLLIILSYNFFQCWLGNFDASCADLFFIDYFLLSIPTVILVYVGVLTTYNYWIITSKTTGQPRPIKYR